MPGIAPGVARRVREDRHHVRRERVEHLPRQLGRVAAVDAHLERRRLSHHPRARRPNAIEVPEHAPIPVGVELRRDVVDPRLAGRCLATVARRRQAAPRRNGVDRRAQSSHERAQRHVRCGADLDLAARLERDASAVRQTRPPERSLSPTGARTTLQRHPRGAGSTSAALRPRAIRAAAGGRTARRSE